MDVSGVTTIVASIGTAVTSSLIVAAVIAKPLRRITRQNDEFRMDWYGMPARPGHAAQPGVMERLATIEDKLNNHIAHHDQGR